MSEHQALAEKICKTDFSPTHIILCFLILTFTNLSVSVHAQECQADLQAALSLDNNSIQGETCVELMLQIDEVSGSQTCDDVPIVVTLSKNSNFTIRYSEFASSLGPRAVSNKDWNYTQNVTHHIWTYKRTRLNRNARSTIGFTGVFDPRSGRGSTSFTMSIQSGSGGEINLNNNTSIVTLNYVDGIGDTNCTPINYTSTEQENADNEVYDYYNGGEPPVIECYDLESGGFEIETFYYTIPVNQEVSVEFDPYNVPDKIDIFVNDVLVGSSGCSGGNVHYILEFNVNAGDVVKIIVDGECSNNSGTAWTMQVCGVDIDPCTAPDFSEQPQNTDICHGDDVTLSVVTSGDNVEVRWYYKENLGDEWIPTSQTGSSMTQTNLTTTTYFAAFARNDCGELWSNTIEVGILHPASIGNTSDITICEGENATVTVNGIFGDAPFTMTLYINGVSQGISIVDNVRTYTTTINHSVLPAGSHSFSFKLVNACNTDGSFTQEKTITVTPRETWYLDEDNDGYHLETIEACESPGTNYVLTSLGDDCDDSDASINPGATEICSNGIDEDCFGGDDLAPGFTLNSSQVNYFEGEDIVITVDDLTNCESCTASWTPNLSGGDINGLIDNIDIPGNANITQSYEVTITNQNGCSHSESIDILILILPDVSAEATDANCGMSGSVLLSWIPSPDRSGIKFGTQQNGGSISWFPQNFNENLGEATINLGVGEYDLWARWGDGTGKVHVGFVSIEMNQVEIESVTVINPLDDECPNSYLGTIEISASGDQLEYSINGIDFQTSHTFTNIIAGTYQVSVRNLSTNCEASQLVDVQELYCDPCYSDLIITEQSDILLANERLRSVDFITLNGISLPQNISVYSGHSIEIAGPFQIEPGAEFLATIDDCECIEGEACDDLNPCTINDVYDADCYCNGEVDPNCSFFDCPDVGNYGDPCDDGIACTVNDILTIFCECEGTEDPTCNPDCTDGSNFGDVCDDGDMCTINDIIDANCQCIGTIDSECDPSACPAGFDIGDSCDDLDECTINDAYVLSDLNLCECKGILVDDNQNGICDDLEACDPDSGLSTKTLKSGTCASHDLNLIVTEFSNGETGSDEYIELFVKGSGTFDLRGVIIDDKEGAYKFGNGVSKGRIRFADHTNWAQVRGGSLILIYNHKQKNKFIGPDDPTDSNADRIYITSLAQPYFYGEQLTKSKDYYPILPSWDLIWLYDKNDEITIRNCDGQLLQNIRYGFGNKAINALIQSQVTLVSSAGKKQVYKDLIGKHELSHSKPSPGKYNNRRHKNIAKNGK